MDDAKLTINLDITNNLGTEEGVDNFYNAYIKSSKGNACTLDDKLITDLMLGRQHKQNYVE